MKILILGSYGQVGSSIKEVSSKYNHQFIFTSKKNYDLTDHLRLDKLINIDNPDVIINCSAFTNVDLAEIERDQSNLINNIALKDLSKICYKKDILLVHLSTDYVFGSQSKNKISFKEEDDTNPLNFYGKTKLDGERSIIESGCKYFIIRTSWVFGPYGNNFLKTILSVAKKNSEVKVINDQEGCPTYSIDIAHAIINLINSTNEDDLNQIFHYCGSQKLTWYTFAKIIFEIAKENGYFTPSNLIPICSSQYKSLAERPSYSVLDTEKIKKYYNVPPLKIEEAIRETIQRRNLI